MTGEMLNDSQRLNWLRLIKSENVGPVTFLKLINRYGSAEQALAALPEHSRRGGLKRRLKICPAAAAEHDMQQAEKNGAAFIAIGEADYPELLRHIDGAPPLICVKGRRELLNRQSVALVGSRNASAVGLKFTRTLAAQLGQADYVTVSGLARGIDTAAHQASLATGTIAVIAGGIDNIYPPENAELYHEIGTEGVIVTEMTPGVRPQARHFPRRNRLISGIALGTVVIEAATRSGSLITARMAAEQNREVFAVPGSPLDPRSGGTNRLIRDGATLVTCGNDILQVLDDLAKNGPLQPNMFASDDGFTDMIDYERPASISLRDHIIELLSPAPTHIDDLIRETGGSAGEIHQYLLDLKLAGRLEEHTGQRFSLL